MISSFAGKVIHSGDRSSSLNLQDATRLQSVLESGGTKAQERVLAACFHFYQLT